MTPHAFSFTGLDKIEALIQQHAEEAAYITLQSRSNEGGDETLGRLDLDTPSAWRVLHEDDAAAFPTPDPPEGRSLSVDELAGAAIQYVRACAERNTLGADAVRYRVRIYAPKGYRMLDGGHFLCRWEDHERTPGTALALATPDLATCTPVEAAEAGEGYALHALAMGYAQFGALLLKAIGQLQGISDNTISKLHSQLGEARGQVDKLVASVLEFRLEQVESANVRRTEERAGDARTQLAKDALEQLGSAASAFFSAQGLTPELSELMGSLTQSPDLMSALRDPAVRALMEDPENLKALAGMLRAAGAQAQDGPAEAPPPGPESPEQQPGA